MTLSYVPKAKQPSPDMLGQSCASSMVWAS